MRHTGMRQNDRSIGGTAMSWLIRLFLAGWVAMLATAASTQAWAQAYPSRPIRLLVSFPPGGAADIVARMVGQPLAARLGQPVVVENRPGANGNLAGDLVARAPPDGYTLLLGPSALFGINPNLYVKTPIDPLKDLMPVASLVSNDLILTASPTLGSVNDFRAFIAVARAAKPALFYGSIGIGSEHHLAMEFLKQQAGIDLVHVPYRGGGSVASLVQAGKLKGLAVSGQRRSRLLPDLPAIAEAYPGYEVAIWQGLFAPVGTPEAIVKRLRDEANAIVTQPEFVEKLAAAGSGWPFVSTLPEFSARIRSDHEKYGKLIKSLGLSVE